MKNLNSACIVSLRHYKAPALCDEASDIIHVFEHSKLILRRTHVLLNFLLCQCQLQCKQRCQKLVQSHPHVELFCDTLRYGERTQSQIAIILFCRFSLNFICCLDLLVYKKIKKKLF